MTPKTGDKREEGLGESIDWENSKIKAMLTLIGYIKYTSEARCRGGATGGAGGAGGVTGGASQCDRTDGIHWWT